MNNRKSYISLNKINSILIVFFMCTTYSYSKDDINFNCQVIGLGHQTANNTGPWRYELGSFKWKYSASMIKALPKVKHDKGEYGCTPVEVKSPSVNIDNGKYFYISGYRCNTDEPSYFYLTTSINGLNINHSLGKAKDIIEEKYIRITIDTGKETKMKVKDKGFFHVSFDCTAQ